MSRAEKAAQQLLDEHAIDAAPVRPDQLILDGGMRLIHQRMQDDVTGMVLRDDRVVIAVNQNHPAEQQRFALAHLLGHQRLHHRRRLLLDSSLRLALPVAQSLPTDREEAEANRFALALLMPETLVRRAVREIGGVPSGELIAAVAGRFEVGERAAAARLLLLGLACDLGEPTVTEPREGAAVATGMG
jgi:Zn-dependent peptidase ImmA (M78 family)